MKKNLKTLLVRFFYNPVWLGIFIGSLTLSYILLLSNTTKATSLSKETFRYIDYVLIGFAALVLLTIIVRFLDTERIGYSTLKTLTNKAYMKSIFSEQVQELVAKLLTKEAMRNTVFEGAIADIEGRMSNKYSKELQEIAARDTILKSIQQDVLPLERNIEKYIDKLQRNSIVNLLIGIIFTGTAIFVLSTSILSNMQFSDMQSFFIHYLPRLALIIFIQIFAFFFLRLYRNNLDDAKYFQNELTNINSKITALKIAHSLGKETQLENILKELSTVERNFKLSKEETLWGIEKAKIEKDIDLETYSQFKEFNLFREFMRSNGQKEKL